MSEPTAAADGIEDPIEQEARALDALCDRLAGFGFGGDSEWVDGFIALLVVGPRAVLPAEWLPPMFGDAFERAFADPQDVQQALAVLLTRWNRVATQLDPGRLLEDESRLHYAPLMSEWDDAARAALVEAGDLDAEAARALQSGAAWADGFIAAFEAFEDDWMRASLNRDEAGLLEAALQSIELLVARPDAPGVAQALRRLHGERRPSRDELVDGACFAVQDLRLMWLEHAARPLPRQVPKAPGRNDPCPCGSGRKFKKCCGAAG